MVTELPVIIRRICGDFIQNVVNPFFVVHLNNSYYVAVLFRQASSGSTEKQLAEHRRAQTEMPQSRGYTTQPTSTLHVLNDVSMTT
jgi:hypothetical protein